MALSVHQQKLCEAWERHTQAEFIEHSVEQTMATMTGNPHINNAAVMTGGEGWEGVHQFYAQMFIPHTPPDLETELISRTVDDVQIVDELIFKFTHTIAMPWMLPGIPPTGKRVEVPLIVIIAFAGDKVAHEHIYWDQASVLVQIGLLDPQLLPVKGIESARQVQRLSKSLAK